MQPSAEYVSCVPTMPNLNKLEYHSVMQKKKCDTQNSYAETTEQGNTIESNFVNKIYKFLDSPAEIQLSSTVTTFRFHLTNVVMDWKYYTSSRLELKLCGTYNTVHLFRVISSQPDTIYSNIAIRNQI